MLKNIKTHLVWVIAILLLIIAALLLEVPAGDKVNSYISFASSIASLILAVVAIFYSIISNQGFYQTLSGLTGLGNKIHDDSEKITLTSDKFIERAERLLKEVSEIPSSVREMASSIEDKISRILPKEDDAASSDQAGVAEEPQHYIGAVTIGGGISLYLIASAAKNSKSFDVKEVFSDKTLRTYTGAFIHALASSKYKGLDISYAGAAFDIVSVGEMNVDSILERGASRDGALWETAREQIAHYFNPPVSEEEEEQGDEDGD